jgi:hypothetical protein
VSVLQDTVQGTHDLAASLILFSSEGQQYEAHNLGYDSSHGVQGTQCCAMHPFQYSNLQISDSEESKTTLCEGSLLLAHLFNEVMKELR